MQGARDSVRFTFRVFVMFTAAMALFSPFIAAPSAQAAGAASAVNGYGWGYNNAKQLGNGTNTNTTVPVAMSAGVIPAGTTFSSVDAGNYHACGIADGDVYCWGDNFTGQLGNGNNTSTGTPVKVLGLPAGQATSVSAGVGTTCAVAGGAAYCWGDNALGQLGNGNQTNTNSASAVDASGVLSGKTVTDISVMNRTTCAVASGAAFCWGRASEGSGYGYLGNGWTLSDPTVSTSPVAVTSSGALLNKTVTGIATSTNAACALASGSVYCWGMNQFGVLGTSAIALNAFRNTPIQVDTSGVLLNKTVTAISAGSGAICSIAHAVASDSNAFCWGYNSSGELGNGSNANSTLPVAVTTSGVLANKSVTAINVGDGQTCAVAANAAYCWGANYYGGLGNNSNTNSNTPVSVNTSGVLEGRQVTAIAAGQWFAVAVAVNPGPLTFSSGAFGSASVGTSSTLSITVTNTGVGAATPSAITPAGTGVSVTGGTCAVGTAIAASSTCTVALSWTPAAAGALSGASLTVAYPGGAAASNNVSLSGTAAAPGPLTFSAGAFGTSTVGSATTLTLTVTNTGAGSATPSAITAAGTGVSVSGGTCAVGTPIAASVSCTVELTWTPNAVGALTGASLTVAYPSSTPTSNAVSLSGTGVQPGPLTFSADSFGSIEVGATATLTTTVTNSGTAAVTPTAISTTGDGVSITGGTCATASAIAVSGSCTVELLWRPTAPGSLSAAILTLAYPGGSNASDQVSLSGTATAPSPTGTLDPIPANAGLTPSAVVTTLNGTTTSASVSANATNTGVDISGSGYVLQLSATTPRGETSPLGANGVLRIDQGGNLVTSGSGFSPNGPVRVYLFSEPVLLGSLTTDAAGNFTGSFPVATTVPVGQHTVQVNGFTPDGEVRSISLGVRVITANAPVTTLGTRVVFEYKSSKLTKKARTSLWRLAQQIPAGDAAKTTVVGVLRSTGATALDRKLAMHRARNVKGFLQRAGLEGAIATKVTKFDVKNTAKWRRVNVAIKL